MEEREANAAARRISKLLDGPAAKKTPTFPAMCRLFKNQMRGDSGGHDLVAEMIAGAVKEYAQKGTRPTRGHTVYAKFLASGISADEFIFERDCDPWAGLTGIEPDFVKDIATTLRTYYTMRAARSAQEDPRC